MPFAIITTDKSDHAEVLPAAFQNEEQAEEAKGQKIPHHLICGSDIFLHWGLPEFGYEWYTSLAHLKISLPEVHIL